MALELGAAEQRARELWAWADGYEDTNEQHARRCRMVARDVLELIPELEAERSGRRAMQENYQRALAVMETRLYREACES